MLNTAEAYKIVFDDLCKCNLLIGNYDAKNGKEQFMYSIGTAMEMIAYRANHETGEQFENMFYKNLAELREKAGV